MYRCCSLPRRRRRQSISCTHCRPRPTRLLLSTAAQCSTMLQRPIGSWPGHRLRDRAIKRHSGRCFAKHALDAISVGKVMLVLTEGPATLLAMGRPWLASRLPTLFPPVGGGYLPISFILACSRRHVLNLDACTCAWGACGQDVDKCEKVAKGGQRWPKVAKGGKRSVGIGQRSPATTSVFTSLDSLTFIVQTYAVHNRRHYFEPN
jgi:hypothetical protein